MLLKTLKIDIVGALYNRIQARPFRKIQEESIMQIIHFLVIVTPLLFLR